MENKQDALIEEARVLCSRLVDKVEGTTPDGRRAISSETYNQCKCWLQHYNELEKEREE